MGKLITLIKFIKRNKDAYNRSKTPPYMWFSDVKQYTRKANYYLVGNKADN